MFQLSPQQLTLFMVRLTLKLGSGYSKVIFFAKWCWICITNAICWLIRNLLNDILVNLFNSVFVFIIPFWNPIRHRVSILSKPKKSSFEYIIFQMIFAIKSPEKCSTISYTTTYIVHSIPFSYWLYIGERSSLVRLSFFNYPTKCFLRISWS